ILHPMQSLSRFKIWGSRRIFASGILAYLNMNFRPLNLNKLNIKHKLKRFVAIISLLPFYEGEVCPLCRGPRTREEVGYMLPLRICGITVARLLSSLLTGRKRQIVSPQYFLGSI